MALTIFPPILASSQPAFVNSGSSYKINFTLPSATNSSMVGHMQIKVVYVTNNKSVVDTSTYPDGIIYTTDFEIDSLGNGTVAIKYSDLADGWVNGSYYKVQLRFGKASELWSSGKFYAWKEAQIEANNFSEWSTVMIIKPIAKPEVVIVNSEVNTVAFGTSANMETGDTPLFSARYSCSSDEELSKYKFSLIVSDEEIDSSGWLQNNQIASAVNSYRFKTILQEDTEYTVRFYIITENEYEEYVDYVFYIQKQELSELSGFTLLVLDENAEDLDSAIKCKEEGFMQVVLTTSGPVSGNYVVSRVCEDDGYVVAHDLKYFTCASKTFASEVVYTDYTIESGKKYKYYLQQENSSGLRSPRVTETGTPARLVHFEYSYLFTDEVQLKLKYNNTMSSFKHTQLAAKQDTIGSKYPTIFKNSYAYYAEFPINGLISLNLDENRQFFTEDDNGLWYKDELILSADRYEEYSTNLTDENIFVERLFRQKVEEFLTGNDYKLFKSPTEGNIIVSLMNISMAPNQQLGRMIYSFSATAYEIMENTIENLDDCGIISIGEYTSNFAENESVLKLGQISGLYTGYYERHSTTKNSSPVDLLGLIKAENNYIQETLGMTYEYYFESLNSIWFEQYPKIDFTQDLQNYDVQISDIKNDTSLTDDEKEAAVLVVEAEKAELQELVDFLAAEVANPIITLVIIEDGVEKEITIGANKIYTFRDHQVDNVYLKYSGAILINYTCYTNVKESIKNTVLSIITSYSWDQVFGMFTTTESILNNYDFYRNYLKDEDGEPISLLPEASRSLVVNKGYDYISGLYQTLDIFAVIEERMREIWEDTYNTTLVYDEETGEWNDGTLFFTLDEISNLEIEADEGTEILLGAEDEDDVSIRIGPTEKYILNPADGFIDRLSFKKPTFAIINFKCETTQKIKGGDD